MDEESLVANTRRKTEFGDDGDDVPPLPSEAGSVTYYSFPHGSGAGAGAGSGSSPGGKKPQVGRSIPSMWMGVDESASSGAAAAKKIRFNTTSSGGLMHIAEGSSAPGGGGGGLLNSGIQKWKAMIMNQRRKSELAASLRANAGVGSGRFSFSSGRD